MWFYKFDEWYRTTTYDNPEESDELKKKMAGVATAAWWLPKWRFAAIRCLAAAWFATVLGVTWKTGDVQFLARQFASFVSNAWQEAFGLGWNRFKIQEHVEL